MRTQTRSNISLLGCGLHTPLVHPPPPTTYRKGLLLQNTIESSDNVLCLLHLCQISN